jgi:hypothetical protein
MVVGDPPAERAGNTNNGVKNICFSVPLLLKVFDFSVNLRQRLLIFNPVI